MLVMLVILVMLVGNVGNIGNVGSVGVLFGKVGNIIIMLPLQRILNIPL